MMKPIIHLNGSDGGTLFKAYLEAVHAMRDALGKLYETAPNGRDYYLADKAGEMPAIQIALSEHGARVTALDKVYRELEELAVHVSDQQDARNSRRAS